MAPLRFLTADIGPAMAPKLLDEEALDIVRGSTFINDAEWYLRKRQRFPDTAIRIATVDTLKKHAAKFCNQHIDKFFPEIRDTGIPDAHLVYGEVLQIYRNLKADLLNRSRLKRMLPPVCMSEPILPSESAAIAERADLLEPLPPPTSAKESEVVSLSASIKLPESYLESNLTTSLISPNVPPLGETIDVSLETPTQHLLVKNRRRRRHRRRRRNAVVEHKSEDVVESSTWTVQNSDLVNVKAKREGWQQDTENSKLLLDARYDQENASPSVTVLLEHLSMPKDGTSADEIGHVMEPEDGNHQLRSEAQRLEVENQTFKDYGTFVKLTLRLCQDTYHEEALSAKRAGIYARTTHCDAVVDVLRDLQSDIDFKYFSDYYLLHGHAPPSRFWLEAVQSRR